jgi:ATP-dependent exoDNAse (exonuclease V) beta subunit
VILFDEAQDADPPSRTLSRTRSRQVIMVGDASQAIYGWRGAVDALSKFEAPHRLTLTQSFRFGNAIADFANRFLDHLNAEVRVVGNEAKDSTVDLPGHRRRHPLPHERRRHRARHHPA